MLEPSDLAMVIFSYVGTVSIDLYSKCWPQSNGTSICSLEFTRWYQNKHSKTQNHCEDHWDIQTWSHTLGARLCVCLSQWVQLVGVRASCAPPKSSLARWCRPKRPTFARFVFFKNMRAFANKKSFGILIGLMMYKIVMQESCRPSLLQPVADVSWPWPGIQLKAYSGLQPIQAVA